MSGVRIWFNRSGVSSIECRKHAVESRSARKQSSEGCGVVLSESQGDNFRRMESEGSSAGGLAAKEKHRDGIPAVGLAAHPIGLLALLVVLGPGLIPPSQSWGQQPSDPPAAEKDAATEPSRDLVEPLGVRYRFLEAYGVVENSAKPYLITQYQVGDAPRCFQDRDREAAGCGAEQSGYINPHHLYGGGGGNQGGKSLPDVVRRDHDVRMKGDISVLPLNMAPQLEGLKIWYRLRRGGFPEIIN